MHHATDETPLSDEHAEMLATNWWSGDKFREHGIPCREGRFTAKETESMQRAIRQYQIVAKLSQEDVEDVVLGTVKREGFWEAIASGVPGRRVRSIHDHAKLLYRPHRDQGNWTEQDDLRLMKLVKKHSNWTKISERMRRSASACRSRYRNHLMYRETRRRGAWSSDEETRLIQVIQALEEHGKTPSNTPSFWKEVSERFDKSRTPNQCRTKWCKSLSPAAKNAERVRWSDADSKILIHKVASLDLSSEDDILWSELIDDSWNTWTAEKLKARWVALKAKVDSATHRDVVRELSDRFSNTRASSS